MAEIVVMPKMNLTMEDGLLSSWYVREGQTVDKGDLLCSVENEKEVGDVDCLYSGVVKKLIGEEGNKYNINDALAIIAQPDEDIAGVLEELKAKKEAERLSKEEKATRLDTAPKVYTKTVIMPKIRKLLKEKDISAEDIALEYGNVKITEKEIEAYEQKYAAFRPAPNDRVEPLSPMMKAISKNMKRSCEQTARLTNFMEVDMTDAFKNIAEEKAKGKKLSVTGLVIKAVALALREHEILNTVYDDANARVIYRSNVNVGCAVDVKGGLLVPVIRNADKKGLLEISEEISRLSATAAEGKLSAADTEGGTFTVTSIGMLDATFFTPIINYPQTAILGVGAVQTLPRYMDGDFTQVHPRKIMTICVTYDHRVINGAPAARFLQSVRDKLQKKEELFDI